MKKSLRRILPIAVFSAVAAFAQPHGFAFGHNGDNGNGNGNSTQTTDPATLAAREVQFLTHLLDLTTGQQTQATTIFTNAITAKQALQTQITTANTALVTAIKANNTANITTQATALGTLRGQTIAIDANASAAFYLLLTADQKTKLDSFANGGFLGKLLPGLGN